jgi:hypothetical protein
MPDPKTAKFLDFYAVDFAQILSRCDSDHCGRHDRKKTSSTCFFFGNIFCPFRIQRLFFEWMLDIRDKMALH